MARLKLSVNATRTIISCLAIVWSLTTVLLFIGLHWIFEFAGTANQVLNSGTTGTMSNTWNSTPSDSSARRIAPLDHIKYEDKPHAFCRRDTLIYKACIGHLVATKRFNETSSHNGDIYWILNFDLVPFVNNTLPSITHYFSLVFATTLAINTPLMWNGPQHTGLMDRILNNKYLLYFFAENYDGTLSDYKYKNEHIVHPLPIGLDMHSGVAGHGNLQQHSNLRQVIKHRMKPFNLKERKMQIYVDNKLVYGYPSYLKKWDALFARNWTVNTKHRTKYSSQSHEILKLYNVGEWQRKFYYRHWAWWQIQNDPRVDTALFAYDKVSRPKYQGFAKRSEYVFALSLFGTGMDCHRTYESLLMSNIVIVQSSPLDILYEKYRLPVVVVQSFKEINATMLKFWYEKYKDFVYYNNAETRHKLTTGFWVDYIRTSTQHKLHDMRL